MILPVGWKLTRTVQESRCPTCHHITPTKPGTLTAPSGRSWPLIGNGSAAAEDKMVEAIVKANPQEDPQDELPIRTGSPAGRQALGEEG